MNRNDMRSVVYLIIALICFYYLIDDFFGKQKISLWVSKFIGDFGGTAAPIAVVDPSTAPATAPAAAPAAAKTQPDTGSVKIPAPQPDLGKVKIPQPQGNQTWSHPKTKTGTSGLSLPDIFNGFNPFPTIAGGAALVGGVAAISQLPRIIGQELGGAF
jgi:hypothetical protein